MDDPELLPISALEHYSYCPRQAALIHVEQIFEDNVFTDRGHLAHSRAHNQLAADGHTRFGVRVWSDRHRLIGFADAVEFRPGGPYPVEYKSGPRRGWCHEAIQLCAQALCLEEMFETGVPEGAVFYQATRNRRTVAFDGRLKARTLQLIDLTRQMMAQVALPRPVADGRCRYCSLRMTCLPDAIAQRRRFGQLRSALLRADV